MSHIQTKLLPAIVYDIFSVFTEKAEKYPLTFENRSRSYIAQKLDKPVRDRVLTCDVLGSLAAILDQTKILLACIEVLSHHNCANYERDICTI